MKNKKILSIFSTVLTLILLLSSIPLSPFVTFATEEAKASEAVKVSLFEGLKEDPAMRDRFTKHYYDKNGTYYAVVYPEQIHYVEDGQWADVDNTLKYDLKTASYVNENPKFSFGFAANSESSNLVTISDGSYTLSWSVRMNSTADDRIKLSENELQSFEVSINRSASAVISAAVSNKKATPEDLTSEIKAVSGIRYSGVLNNEVDLRYTAYHGKIEEDVILNEKGTFESYTMTVNTDGLTATVADDSSVVFTNAEGKTVFTIAAPWMCDANGELSDDITVSITQIRNTAYITYTPSAEWLSDDNRAYPVLIDPSVTSRYYTNNYQDTYVASGDSTSYASQRYMFVGNKSSKNIKALIKIINMPEILGSANVGEAKFNFWLTDTSNPTLKISHANSAWNASTVTYANCPTGTFIDSGTRLKTEVSDVEEDPYEVDSFVSYSRYSYDITDWLNGEVYDNDYLYFFDDYWNGFIIEYNTLTTGQNVRIWSSEHTEAKFRPTITFKYEFEQNECLESGAVYSISNVKTGKYLTVESGIDANGTNVYQYAKNSTRSQAFRLDYNSDSEAFRLRAMCSSDGAGRVLNISYASTIDNTTGYQVTNLDINAYSSNHPENQEWLFVPVSNDRYKIVSAYDPSLAITAYGSSNGTANLGITDDGNIAVRTYNGSTGQLWYIESGGETMTESSVNVSDLVGEANVGTNTTKLFYPMDIFGYESLGWSMQSNSVASISSTGVVTTINPGSATARLLIMDGDDDAEPINVTLYSKLPDGVYTLQNRYSNGYLELPNGDLSEGVQYILWNQSINNNSRFKLAYIGEGKYVLRSMLVSHLGLYLDTNYRIVNAYVSTTDSVDSVPLRAQWTIADGYDGLEIRNVGTGLYMEGMTYEPGYDSLATGGSLADNEYQGWNIVKIDNYTSKGLTFVNKTDKVAVGDQFTFSADMYSSTIGENGPVDITWSVTNSTGVATIDSSGNLVGESSGVVMVTATYSPEETVVWTNSCFVIIYLPTDIETLRMTRDATDEYTLCVATLYNGEKYWYQIDDEGNCSDVLLLSSENKAVLNEFYNDYLENGGSPYSIEYCVYQAKNKLNAAIANNQLYNVSESSDEYFGLWFYFSLVEAHYREGILTVVNGVNTIVTFVDIINKAYVIANNIHLLANTLTVHNSAQIMSGTYAVTTYSTMTNQQAVELGITDVSTYVGPRPTWRESEIYVSTTRFTLELGYKYNKSYELIDGKLEECYYGKKGSIRPDCYNKATEHFVEVKNYTITTSSGRNNLVNNVVNQYNQRVNMLPDSTKYEVVIDVRGQEWTQDMLNEIERRIDERSNGAIIVSYMK